MSACTEYDLVVVGAGMAGLAAAATARAVGAEVLVLEARERTGGRVDTRTLGSGAVELGAQVLHGSSNCLLRLCGPGEAVEVDRGDIVTGLLDGRGRPRAFSDTDQEFCSPTVMAARLRALAAHLGPMADAMTLESVLALLRASPLTEEALRSWYEQVTGADAASVPLAEICSQRVYQYHGDREHVVPGGLYALVARLSLDLEVRLSWVASRVVPTGAGVMVEGSVAGTAAVVTARACVLTVPPPVVGSGALRVEGMSEQQWRAAQALRMADAVAVVVPLAAPAPHAGFLFDVAGGLGFVSWRRGEEHLTVISKGGSAPRLRSAAARPDGVRAAVVAALPWAAPSEARADLLHDWGSDPFAGGAFTAPSASMVTQSALWRAPVGGRVFLAGEATDCASGSPFLDRAFSTGVAAARQALALVPVGSP